MPPDGAWKRAALGLAAVAALLVLAAALGAGRKKERQRPAATSAPRGREGFGFDWANWPVGSERENFAPPGECAGATGGPWRRARAGFSPDRPGACVAVPRRAAHVEAAGLWVAAGG